MRYRELRPLLSGLVIVAMCSAATSASLAKPKKARAETAPRNGAILVINSRSANLLELTATPEKGGAEITIARDVVAGGRAAGKLPAKAGCVFSLSGRFDDESTLEAAGQNLCKDGRINLVD